MCAESQPAEYTMADLHELIFPSDMDVTGHLCMVYNCFLDDSKDQKQEQMIVSAGFFGVPKAWEQFRPAWNACLRTHGIKYFKTSECRMLNGEFAKFKGSDYPKPSGKLAANAIRDELRNILENASGINGIGVAIPVADYEEVCAMPEAQNIIFGKPYHQALQSVVIKTLEFVGTKVPGRNMAAFVHDDGPDFDDLRGAYKTCMDINKHWAKYSGGFVPLDDKKTPPLQAADMAANYALGLGQSWLENGRNAVAKKEFENSIKWIGVWEKPFILTLLKRQYVHRKLPIPERLQCVEG